MSHIYQEILGRVTKPVRYIGNEWNIVRKPWETTPNRVCLAFPDTYEIGMSHLGLRILYSLLNKDEHTLAERAYCPWPDMEQEIRAAGLPLVAMESQRPLRDFDVVGFSLQYEMEYTNVLTMLELGGIPFYTAERAVSDPLVIGGGSCVFSPEPVADFFDCFLIGDGERVFPQVIELFCSLRRRGHSRRELLEAIAQLPGIYVPSLYHTEVDPQTGFEVVTGSDVAPFPVKRTYIEDLSEYPFPTDILVPNTEIVHDRVSYEIARGCTEGCRFCQAGTIYRPVRERKPTEIVEAIQSSLKETGYDGVSLTSLSTADYSCISPVLQSLVGELERSKTSVSVSSLRVYGLTETMADEISKVRKTGFTIAPEAGTQRLRDVINKGISEEEILRGARTAFQKGWNRIKLYFMIGLPTETEEDLRGIVELAQRMITIARSEFNRRVSVTVSASTLIPKAHSPFQWCAMNDRESIRQKQELLRALIRPLRNIELRLHDLETSYLEGVISRGDRRLAKAIELAWRKGARFDAWHEGFHIETWNEVFEELGLESTIEQWLGEIPLVAPLPWDHIDSLVEKRFLIRELKRALASKFSPACEKPFKKYNSDRVDLADPTKDTGKPYVCYDCGLACDLDAIKAERQEAWKDVQGLKVALRERRQKLDAEAADAAEPIVVRYRASYQKLGEFRYLSQLDLTRTLIRAFNRSELPLKFSKGFHPMPDLSFGPALPLGVEGCEEWLDFCALVDRDPAQLLAELNAHMSENLRFTSLQKIPTKSAALFQAIDTAAYSIALDGEKLAPLLRERGVAEELGELELHQRVVDELLARPEIVATVKRKGKERRIDIRPLIKSIELVNGERPLSLRVVVGAGASGNLRPEVLLHELYGDWPQEWAITREGLFVQTENGLRRPVELDAFEPAPIPVPRDEAAS